MRYLLIDHITGYDPGKSMKGVKNVAMSEDFLEFHFPKNPIMPGVMLLEALAQATGILGIITVEHTPAEDAMYFLVGVDNARFKRPVGPGDQVCLDVELHKVRRNIFVYHGEASVDQRLVASADLMCTYRSMVEIRN